MEYAKNTSVSIDSSRAEVVNHLEQQNEKR